MKKQLTELVKNSYKDGKLDEKLIEEIADHLSRHKLKMYIKLIKQEEKKTMVYVTTPKPLSTDDRKKIAQLFPRKKVVEAIDPTMISGIKLVENDEEYEINLNRTFHDIIRFVSKND